MTAAKTLRAIALGLLLATFPYIHWATARFAPHHAADGTATGAHADHAAMDPAEHVQMHGDHDAHHGGQLGMAGNYHLELVRRDRTVEIYPSDAIRKPLTAIGGSLDYGDGIPRKLRWTNEFLLGPYVTGSESVTAVVQLENGEQVEIEFWFPTSGS